jgi:lipoprotein-anchoring transpeptidase ErfK/SrfK
VLVRLPSRTSFDSPRYLAVVARRGAWLGVLAPELRGGRVGWISARRDVLVEPADWRIDVSLARRRVTVRASGRVMQSFPVATGAALTPTPTGTYGVTDRLRFSGGSPYGCCALALTGHQTAIAQGWGGGDRLAIHGTTNEASIGTAASHGCLRARRTDVARLVATVPLGTRVVVR